MNPRGPILALALLSAVAGPSAWAETPTETSSHAAGDDLDARFEADEASGFDSYEGPGFGQTFFEMVVVLGGVCLLAYLLLGKLLPRLLRVPGSLGSRRLLTVIDRMPLDPKRSILIVKMGEQHFLIGNSEHGLTLLSRLDANEVRDAMAAAEAEQMTPSWTGWTSLLKRRSPREEI